MDKLVAIDNSDLLKPNPRWNPDEWIGCGKSFQNIPDFVAIEALRAISVPPNIQASLPPKDLNQAEFFAKWSLPHWDTNADSADDAILYRIPDKVNLKDNVAEASLDMAMKYNTLLLEEKGLIAGVTRGPWFIR
ncbi:hypothetical protein B0H11DRAFT_2220207 [Mycena galericulata]|nr:hypothetical protein B0H11DRAFT_2220207 [Mycena galericulata]